MPARGFTLVEMLVALCVLALTLAAGVPLTASIGDRMRLASVTHAFLAELHLARSEAIKRNAAVVVCKSRDGVSCASSGGWEQGWIVFHDRDGDGLRDADEPIVHAFGASPAGFRVVGNAMVARYVSFVGTGATRTTTGAFQAGTVTVCRASRVATEGRQIVINAVGRPRILKVSLASCP